MARRKRIPKAVRDKLLVEAMHRCCLCPEHHDVTDLHHIVPINEDGPNTARSHRLGGVLGRETASKVGVPRIERPRDGDLGFIKI